MKKILGTLLFSIFFAAFLTGHSFAGEKDRYWKKFNPGSWVLYELQDGMREKISLITKTDAQVSLKTEMLKGGNVVTVSEEIIPLDLSTDAAVAPKPGMREYVQDTMVAGQAMACKIYELDTKDGPQRTWISEQIPGGLVKAATGDTVMLNLIDYEAKYYVN